MGINLTKPRKNHLDRNKWYKREYVNNMKLIQGAPVGGVFYSKDKDFISLQSGFAGNIKKTIKSVVIITHDNVWGLEPDDYVMYAEELWLVDGILFNGDNNEFSTREGVTTEVTLRR
jgi:hypothetical protein